MSEPVSYTNRTITSVKENAELLKEYIAVSKRLHGETFLVTESEFEILLHDPKELVTFILIDGQLVATAQATLQWTPPELQAFINNVVTHTDFGGRGLGRLVMESLEQAIKVEWGEGGTRSIKLGLSNSPQKENGGFFWARCA